MRSGLATSAARPKAWFARRFVLREFLGRAHALGRTVVLGGSAVLQSGKCKVSRSWEGIEFVGGRCFGSSIFEKMDRVHDVHDGLKMLRPLPRSGRPGLRA